VKNWRNLAMDKKSWQKLLKKARAHLLYIILFMILLQILVSAMFINLVSTIFTPEQFVYRPKNAGDMFL
jgi:hypothetical protein